MLNASGWPPLVTGNRQGAICYPLLPPLTPAPHLSLWTHPGAQLPFDPLNPRSSYLDAKPRLQGSKRGAPGLADFDIWLSRLTAFEVGPWGLPLRRQCRFYYHLDPCPPPTGRKLQVSVMGTYLRFKALVSSSQNTLNLSLTGFWRMAQNWLGNGKLVLSKWCARVCLNGDIHIY